jgi:phenylpyruvate tautomerase PptA (4-oxalocrotonate tautomerase family)
MPWINLTIRKGALTREKQHALMADLTAALMWWEKIPDNPVARNFMKGWVYEVAEDADYRAGVPNTGKPSYFIEVRIPANRFDQLTKLGVIRDFTKLVLTAEGSEPLPENSQRIWVTINELEKNDWGINGNTDWLRSYTSAMDNFESALAKLG